MYFAFFVLLTFAIIAFKEMNWRDINSASCKDTDISRTDKMLNFYRLIFLKYRGLFFGDDELRTTILSASFFAFIIGNRL